MPNYCYNHMTIDTENQKDFDALVEFFGKYKNYDYFTDWCDTLIHDHPQDYSNDNKHDVVYKYGTRWWDFEVEATQSHLGSFDGTIDVFGDSAWSPPLGLAELISKLFDCEVRIEFSEPGMDFAGIYTYVDGNPTREDDYKYNEFQYLEVDRDYAVDEIVQHISDGWYKDEADLIDDISYMREEDIDYLVDTFKKVEA